MTDPAAVRGTFMLAKGLGLLSRSNGRNDLRVVPRPPQTWEGTAYLHLLHTYISQVNVNDIERKEAYRKPLCMNTTSNHNSAVAVLRLKLSTKLRKKSSGCKGLAKMLLNPMTCRQTLREFIQEHLQLFYAILN